MKKIFSLILLTTIINSINAQDKNTRPRISVGTTFSNLNENFEDIFLFNNSRPIIAGLDYPNLRIESITNVSIENSPNNDETSIRGSIRLSLDYKKKVSNKMQIYFGPQYGLHSSRTHLLNLHLGGEYFLHKNWSISSQIGVNFLFVNSTNQTLILTNNSFILRFYINTKKNNDY